MSVSLTSIPSWLWCLYDLVLSHLLFEPASDWRKTSKGWGCVEKRSRQNLVYSILGDSWNYMPPTLVPFSAKRIATQILVIAILNGRKDFSLRFFVCDIIHPSKELPVQS